MNTNNVKKYAPKARNAFIAAMSKQAAKYGITKKKIEPAEQKGDLVLIGDRPFPASVIKPRERLVKRIEQQGFDQLMEHVAYSWFNRLCAIRYMERKGFLDHGRRVLSAADGSAGVPQILEECLDVELPGLDQAKVRELKLDGTKDEELYRELLLAQCHALHQAMPFLFEAVADESELLLPENLTKTDSLIRELVASVPDEDWDHIEIIGWLYQFYISEKKDQVMGKVVKSEDIPAATQLFTPNWIVQYLVQNSVGRQWLQTYPNSPLKEKMPYYIEPAEQTPEVQAELAAIVPKELKPEELSATDICCGSGHILIEAYKLFKFVYEERGYRTRDIPQLILENNIFGLDIDDRAGQLAGFALMMLAREDDRRIFSRNIRLNVVSLQESSDVNLPSLWRSLNLTGEWRSGTSQGLFEEEQQDLSAFAEDNRYQLLQRTLDGFKQAKTFGSLINVLHDDYNGLKEIYINLRELEKTGDTMQKSASESLIPFIHQALLLAKDYDAVISNPPYMGNKSLNKELKEYGKKYFPDSKLDLFAMFMERGFDLLKSNGLNAQVDMHSWMFISSYEELRKKILSNYTIQSLVHLGARAFSQISGEVVQTCAWVISNRLSDSYTGSYIRLVDGSEEEKKENLRAWSKYSYVVDQADFWSVPGAPINYWLDDKYRQAFQENERLSNLALLREGMTTSNNERFLRLWHEVPFPKIKFVIKSREESKNSQGKWFPYNKGGGPRKWYGNNEYVVNWENDGEEVCSYNAAIYGSATRQIRNMSMYFKPSLTWSAISSYGFTLRKCEEGFIFDSKGPSIFYDSVDLDYLQGILSTPIADYFLSGMKATLDYRIAQVGSIPIKISEEEIVNQISILSRECQAKAKEDWDDSEVSFGFKQPYCMKYVGHKTIKKSFNNVLEDFQKFISEFEVLEEKLSKTVLNEYGLEDILRYKGAFNEFNRCVNKYQSDDELFSQLVIELISYSVGCIMGRYSLDREGVVYANTSNEGFSDLLENNAYETFPADDDGIIPLTDQEWFPDDATNRFREFVKVVWGGDHLHENLDFVAESLCLHSIKPKKSESSMDTIRRYLSTQFYKDHMKTYKKRPIYWLFSSGKQKAFECLVYLHRYNEGTLARMRTEYVIPLTAKMATYAQKLENDKEASGSAAEVKRLEKEISQLHKQQAELSEFDEKLRHYADQRISLDLDDGVKVNYGKFGDLLAEVKAITGEAPEVLS